MAPSLSAGAVRAKKRKLAELAADLPQDLGATAEGRHAAFATTRSGGPRMSVEAARKAASHAQLQTSKYLKVMVRCGHLKEAAAVMGGQARDPELRLLNPAAGLILSEDASAERQMMANVGEMPNRDGGGRGNRSEDAARFASAVAVAVTDAASPAKVGRQRAPASRSPGRSRPKSKLSVRQLCRSLGLGTSRGQRLFKKARSLRRSLNKGDAGAYLVDARRRLHVSGRKGRLSDEQLERLWAWVRKSPYNGHRR